MFVRFSFSFKSVCRYVRPGELRMGMVPVLTDAKKMTVGRRKRKRVGGCEKEYGAVGRSK